MTPPPRALTRAAAARLPRRFASTTSHAKGPSTSKRQVQKTPPRVSTQYKPPQRPATSPDRAHPRQPETLQDIWRRSWIPLTGAAFASAFLGFYIFGTIAATLKDGGPCNHCESATPTGRPPALTGDNAEQFDKELNWDEWWMGIRSLRQRLAKRARGHVLELAMGTGRNLEYYNWETLGADDAKAAGQEAAARTGITSFTGLDISVDMLDVARKKLVKAVPPMASSAPIVKASTMADHTGGELSYLQGQLRLIHSDAHHQLPLPPSSVPTRSGATGPKYDTVIQTFGLCSVSDPVAVLSNLASVVKPESGRIILLEHGKGWYGLVNGLLDKNASKHFAKFGCWWNRDIPFLVEQAVAKTPGLEIVKVERPNMLQLGTLVWIELRVVNKPQHHDG
ncbi:hypothetical protein S40288_04813 [Stachybotrys chartarum IBT 40288]|nr:hypothetical protein S40288_04813 [Stachybotrys chartarum IBT 40288]